MALVNTLADDAPTGRLARGRATGFRPDQIHWLLNRADLPWVGIGDQNLCCLISWGKPSASAGVSERCLAPGNVFEDLGRNSTEEVPIAKPQDDGREPVTAQVGALPRRMVIEQRATSHRTALIPAAIRADQDGVGIGGRPRQHSLGEFLEIPGADVTWIRHQVSVEQCFPRIGNEDLPGARA